MTAALHLYIKLQDTLREVQDAFDKSGVPLRFHLTARVLQDALTEATADYWERRAQQFEAAAPKLGEYHGNATRDQLNEAWLECMTIAQACRAKAQFFLMDETSEEISDEVASVLEEVA